MFSSRTEGSEFLNQVLDNDCLLIRRRTNRVNIKITFLSWTLEFLTGIFVILVRVYKINQLIHWAYLIDVCLVFVVIPCTYVLNREVTKQIIVFGNWYQGIKSIFCVKKPPTRQINALNEPHHYPSPPPLLKYIGNDISQKRINVSQRKKIRKNTPKNVSPQNRVSALPQTQHVSRLISPPQKPAIAIDMKVLHRNFLKKIAHIPDADRTT